MSNGMPYDSDEGRAVAGAITALMTGRGYRKSAEIAAAVGTYEAYEKNREPHNKRDADASRRLLRDRADLTDDEELLAAAQRSWDEAVALGDEHGYRNAQATVLAPTGTISFLMDCDTTGIEPDFSLVKYKELVGGGKMTIVNRSVASGAADARLLARRRSSRSRPTSTTRARSSARRSSTTSTCRSSTSRSASGRSATRATSR